MFLFMVAINYIYHLIFKVYSVVAGYLLISNGKCFYTTLNEITTHVENNQLNTYNKLTLHETVVRTHIAIPKLN